MGSKSFLQKGRKKVKTKLYVVLTLLLLASLACSVQLTDPTVTPMPTETPMPTATPGPSPTPMPDYQAIMVEAAQTGHIPSECIMKPPRRIDPPGVELQKDKDALAKVELEWFYPSGDLCGLSLAMLFKDSSSANMAWQEIYGLPYFEGIPFSDKRDSAGMIGAYVIVGEENPQVQAVEQQGSVVLWVISENDPGASKNVWYLEDFFSYLEEYYPEWLEFGSGLNL